MLQQQAYRLFYSEIENWQLAKDKYSDLKASVSKRLEFGDFGVDIVCNPARIRSTMAEVRQKLEKMRHLPNNSLAAAAVDSSNDSCFLCTDRRPKEQKSIEVGDFEILVNPYPIFPIHFTIVYKKHIPQQILPYFGEFLDFARNLTDFAVFYNGANCGASAPFHLHFQAAEKRYFNVIGDYSTLPQQYFEVVERDDKLTLTSIRNYLRKVFVISTADPLRAKAVLERHFMQYIDDNMINIICCYEGGKYRIFVFPRQTFRPSQFFDEDPNRRLAISPASVEMSGCFVTIFREHFDRLDANEIVDIYRQIS